MHYKVCKYIVNCFLVCLMLSACNGGSTAPTAAPNYTQPTINNNNINMFFIQRLESNSATANLSTQGLNHSLLLGQLVYQIIGPNNIESIYAEMPETYLINGYPDMGTLQTIEDYAELNKKDIIVQLNYSSPESNAQIINSVLAANEPANYVFTLPYNAINSTMELVSSTNDFTFSPLQANQYGVYQLLTKTPSEQITVTNYNDGINASSTFPYVDVTTGESCLQKSFIYQTPENAVPIESVNINSTTWLIRHAEAHYPPWFDDGNLVCQGFTRSLALPQVLPGIIGVPDFVYSSDPAETVTGVGSTSDIVYSYVRPSLTVNPYTIFLGQPLNLIPATQFTYDDYQDMANYFYTQNGPLSGSQYYTTSTLVSWEHLNLEKSVRYLIESIYQQPVPKDFPIWTEPDYDSIWKLEFNSKGQMTFSNTCQGIPSRALPESCPTFSN